MNRFVASIKRSLETENWYAALAMALVLPDICGRLEDPKKRSQERYEAWFGKYLAARYSNDFFGEGFTFLTGSDCYALRCAMLHEGKDDVQSQKAKDVVSRFAFTVAGSHLCKFDSVLLLDVRAFCTDICAGVEAWSVEFSEVPDVKARISELLVVQTSGFSVVPGVFIQ